jgi:predicted Zn-dependent protease
MSWSRRQWLTCAGAASGSALMTIACGGATRRLTGAQPEVSSDEVRSWLREAVGLAQQRWSTVEGLAMRHDHSAAAVDGEGGNAGTDRHSGALLAATDGNGRRYEVSGSQLDRPGLLALAEHLVRVAEARRLPRPAPSAATAAAPAGAAAALASFVPLSAAELVQQAAELAGRVDAHGSSRIVYRGAGIDLDATTLWYVSGERELEQRLLRRRDAITAVAASGGRPRGTEVASGRGAVQLVRGAALLPGAPILGGAATRMTGRLIERMRNLEGPSEAEILEGVERALRLTTPQAIAAGAAEVVLDPSLVGALFEALLTAAAAPEQAAALARWREQPRKPAGELAAPAKLGWQLLASPSAAGAYGGYAFDDRGLAAAPAAPIELIRDGALAPSAVLAPRSLDEAPAGLQLRPGHLGTFVAASPPQHLEIAAAGVELEDLIGRVKTGFALEGATLARVDFAADRFLVHTGLARELRRGTYSGRAFADLELSGSLGGFLASIAGWSLQRRTLSRRDVESFSLASPGAVGASGALGEVRGLPRFWSAELPWLLGFGSLRPRGTE